MIVRTDVKVWEGLVHTKSGEVMAMDLSPEEKARLGRMEKWEGTLDRGQAQGAKSQRRDSPLHTAQEQRRAVSALVSS